MSRVFVVNEPLRQGVNGLERFFDLSQAALFGELVHLLPPGHLAEDSAMVCNQLRTALRDATSEDYLLPIGSPVAIGVATALASERTGGKLRFLRWNPRRSYYAVVDYDLNLELEDRR